MSQETPDRQPGAALHTCDDRVFMSVEVEAGGRVISEVCLGMIVVEL